MDLFAELNKRNIFKVAFAYVALGWVVIQVTDMAVPALNLPETLNSIVFYLGMIGFPFALFFAWAFELTPDGVKRTEDVEEDKSIHVDTGKKLQNVIIALLAVALSFVVWENYLSSPVEETEIAQNDPGATPPTEIGKSIAVLPFVNMSDDKDYFADGLSEELLNLLAKNRDLKVAGRTSSFAFKGENRDLRNIGSELSVATVLEGSVRRSGDRIRITAQLINVEDGYHLWSETYDRELVDIFDIQDEVAKSITDALQVTLSGDESEVRDRPTDNLEAYAIYLEALTIQADTLKSVRIGLARYNEAIAHDPSFGEAWIGRAVMAYNHILFKDSAPSEGLERAHAYTLDALTVVPSSGFLEGIVEATRGDDYDWYEEIKAFNYAFEVEPNNVFPKVWQIYSFNEAGYRQQALALGNDMYAIEPLDSSIMTRYAVALSAAGERDRAREIWAKAVDRGVIEAAGFYFVDRLLDGDKEGAIEIFETVGAIHGLDYSGIRALVEAEFNGQPLDPELAADFDLGHDFMAQFDLGRGRLDKYMDELIPVDMDMAFSSADNLIYLAMAFPEVGFTAHSRFLEVATKIDMIKLWDQYGPPDMCSKDTGEWVCN
ncbi:MAG: hypothetical protein HOJ34_06420 [Kordiimonadaceae bacterium]|nr:hypothetical protein [Kordiimonadaceae bacterium]MBT6329400.1 hypothetical protein [Kordiimonadaceae bacterium]